MENTQNNLGREKLIYSAPKIIAEIELETRAGSPAGIPDPLDLPD